MRDEQSLRQSVLDNPDADEPRLVYADYLEENGNAEWAWQIRHQIAHPDQEYWSVRDHKFSESVLKHTHHVFSDWRHPVPDGFSIFNVAYKRGFAEKLFCELPYWVENHEEILSRNPIRKVIIQDLGAPNINGLSFSSSNGVVKASIYSSRYRDENGDRLLLGIIDATNVDLSDFHSVMSACFPGPEYTLGNYFTTTEAVVIIRPHSPVAAPTDGE